LQRPFATGLILVATAAGAPFLIKLTILAKADVALSATLLVLLLPVTIVYMPLVVPLALPEARINAGAIAKPLLLSMLLPLAVGLFTRARCSHLAARLQPIMSKTSSVALVVLIATTFVLNFDKVLGLFGQRAIFAALIVTAGAFVIGYLLGGADPDKRDVLGLGTAQRNISAATVVATQSFNDDPNTIATVIVASTAAWGILFPIAHAMRKRELARAEASASKLK
jgi:BASS family bile acid:Na+ symporter